jgi:hypothetical protein
MRQLAKGQVKLNKLAKFTESSIQDVKDAALNFGQPTPGSGSDEYISFQKWRFCPSCVREKRPHQKLWLVSFVTACPIHECQLVDSCQSCDTFYSNSHMLSLYCSKCQKPAGTIKAYKNEVDCSKTINELLDKPRELKQLLDRLMLGWLITNPNCLRPHFRLSPQLKTVSEMREITLRLWSVCRDKKSLSLAISNYPTQLLKKWPQLNHLANIFIDRAKTLGANLPKQSSSCSELIFELPESDWWVPIEDAAKSIGFSAFVLRELVKEGYLVAQAFNEKDHRNRRHKFMMIELNYFNDFIEKVMDHALPIDEKSELIGIKYNPLHEITRDVLDGRLRIYKGPSGAISDLKVVSQETAKAKRREIIPEDALTTKQAAVEIQTYHEVIIDLLKHGYLEKHEFSMPARILIKSCWVDNFKDKYILVGNIAKKHGVNATNLSEKLKALGILPDSNKTLVKVYLKRHLEKLDLAKLEALSSYATNTGRKATFSEQNVTSQNVKKLIHLVNSHGGLSAFTKKFGGSQGTLSQILREKKSFGRLAAKRMEEKVGLPNGWFDFK